MNFFLFSFFFCNSTANFDSYIILCISEKKKKKKKHLPQFITNLEGKMYMYHFSFSFFLFLTSTLSFFLFILIF